jgi:hypothetical protein
MIKNIQIKNNDPAIIEVEFEPIDQQLIDEIYSPANFEQLTFENLKVESGRKKISNAALEKPAYKKIEKHFRPMFKEITKFLTDMDKTRYPVFYDFEDWWEKNNFDEKLAFMLVQDEVGFSQPYHLDNRFSMWAGSINLADNNTRTVFSNSNHTWESLGHNSEERFYQATGEKFKGTFWLNTENNWHAVPLVNENRRAIVCNLLLAN